MRALLAVLLTGLVLSAAPAQAQTPAVVYGLDAFASTNVQRVNHGRTVLAPAACLQRYAARQAARMAQQERMFHQDLGPIGRNCGLSIAGENVAFGFVNGRSVVAAWMDSPGHRANILKREYRLMGLAARRGDDGAWYVSQVFGRRAR